MISDKVNNSFNLLKKYCESVDFIGYDPYDGLNSIFFDRLPIINNKTIRLYWIQFFKRCPLNFRTVFRIEKQYNSKAMGLFLSAYCTLYNYEHEEKNNDNIIFFIKKINELKSDGYEYPCWGYPFDWQSKAFFIPKNTPNIVTTSFVANALLDAYEISKDEELLIQAKGSCNFILENLHKTNDQFGNYAFAYSPLDQSVVFNASLLAARLLSRVYSITKDEKLLNASNAAVRYCCTYQHMDGSWAYGKLPYHQWIDSFHTGYNLECIADVIKYTGNMSYSENLKKGFKFYINNFITKEGKPKYYSNSTYPVDIHSAAQLTITLIKLNKLEEYGNLFEQIMNWTIDNMQSPKGYFYFQKTKIYTNKIPYLRWSQAWMYYALSLYIANYHKINNNENMV